ncbi:hypothetical protein AVEN_99971-1 [Araneus ventricosus]|uniref:Uncharacterized protein n=1 Tax=Araneus ventricosus TaxID=182803 RepID=A0A4Y2SY34_ARAVE|nr:hypothetical protein AVEN_336-1 [Araneus ventricosus]GBN91863.1 hypothetical protein AVEN_99971-1 [Araneus ventricosus]
MVSRIWKEYVFLNKWTYGTIIPIAKLDKYPPSPGNYKPIALKSCLCEFEKIVNARLIYVLEVNKYISFSQSGFYKGRYTVDNLIAHESSIGIAFLQRHHLVSVFSDIEKAYDWTCRYGLLKYLCDLHLR